MVIVFLSISARSCGFLLLFFLLDFLPFTDFNFLPFNWFKKIFSHIRTLFWLFIISCWVGICRIFLCLVLWCRGCLGLLNLAQCCASLAIIEVFDIFIYFFDKFFLVNRMKSFVFYIANCRNIFIDFVHNFSSDSWCLLQQTISTI